MIKDFAIKRGKSKKYDMIAIYVDRFMMRADSDHNGIIDREEIYAFYSND